MSQSYFIIGIFWVVYLTLHSVFAADSVKSWFAANAPWVFQYYRLFYSLFSVLGMLLFAVYMSVIESHVVWPDFATAKYSGMVLAAWGVIIVKRSFRAYSFREFVGFNKEESEELVVDGLQSNVRHPLYSGTILIIIGFFLYSPTYEILISMTLIFMYLAIGIRLEERKLVRVFGSAYQKYQQEVPMLIPRLNR